LTLQDVARPGTPAQDAVARLKTLTGASRFASPSNWRDNAAIAEEIALPAFYPQIL
jgi:hypothetical protein